ncbi:MAG: site-2 protease family protein [bacterium]
MAIIIFIIILSVLIIVHELGHFLVAKKFGIRVDEFGVGYPPKIRKLFSWRGTDFTLNWLPFGGFVKIFGEDGDATHDQESLFAKSSDIPTEHGQTLLNEIPERVINESFAYKNRGIQASVLVAGVVCNFLFAWLLIAVGFTLGMPASESMSLPLNNPHTVITSVLSNSPAKASGLLSGDTVLSVSRGENFAEITPTEVAEFISFSKDPMTLSVLRGDKVEEIVVAPEINESFGGLVIGVSMDTIGTVKLSPPQALWQGLVTTSELTVMMVVALGNIVLQIFSGQSVLANLTGPVGLVGLVGQVAHLGFVYILSFTALISINLAIINLLPFPALDGGRLLFVIIESISRRKIPAKAANILNTVGFALLLLLMILVTVQDVRNIF